MDDQQLVDSREMYEEHLSSDHQHEAAADIGLDVEEYIQQKEEAELENEQENAAEKVSRKSTASAESFAIQPFGFNARTSFDATGGLTLTRSQSFVPFAPQIDDNIWNRKPPNFRPQCYAPRPPKRNSRDAVKPWMYKSESDCVYSEYQKRKEERLSLPHILKERSMDNEKFETRFRIPGSNDAKLAYPREGMYPPGPYKMPKPHDFRGYPPIQSLGLPEFDVNYEHDPFNLKFKSHRLNTIHGLNTEPPTNRDIRGRQMAPPKTPQPKYDSRLILPFDQWPTKHSEYTRYRRIGRTPHSALMERIETKLEKEWAREKMERSLRNARNMTAHV